MELNHKQWEATSGELIKTLEKILGVSEGRPINGVKTEDTNSSKPSARSGGMLWIAVAALFVIAAGTAFWQFSPVDDSRTSQPPLAGKDQSGESKLKMAQQSHSSTVPETVVSAGPRQDRIESTSTAIVTVTAKEFEPSEPVSDPAPVAAGPTPVPPKQPVVVDPVPDPKSRAVAADPVPIPVKPVQVKPEQPPIITSLTTQTGKTDVSVCYQVVRAQKLRLTPMPGDLKIHTKDCVNVDLEKPTKFTLSATGPGGSSSMQITVSPHPATIAEMKQRSKLPGKGERWVYQTRGKWPTSPRLKFQISIDHADMSVVSETMSVLEPMTKTAGSRSSSGGNPGFVYWPDIGLEFSPWMGAYIELSGKKNWEDFATPNVGSWDRWSSNASTTERERVKVPAGSFDAWKVEVWSSRSATGGSTLAGQEPVRMQFQVWYAPQIKRYVKSLRKILSASGQIQEEDLFELIEYKTN